MAGAVTGELVRAVGEGYVAPRASIRRWLDRGLGLETALTFLALGYLVQAILSIAFGGMSIGIGVHLVNIALQIAAFFLISGLIYAIGRAAGGKGSLQGAQLVVGWHGLVTSLLAPLTVSFSAAGMAAGGEGAAAPEISAGATLMVFVYVTVSFWLMANYVAELHQFRSSWGVLGALVGLTFACGLVLISLAGALAPQ